MKILLSLIVTAASIFPVAGHCDNTQPVVVGLLDEELFTFPSPGEQIGKDREVDGNETTPLRCKRGVTYKVNETISFKTYNSTGDEITKTLVLNELFTNATELTVFTQLCEELWVLSDYFAQSSAIAGGTRYSTKGLCFGDYCYDTNLNSARAQFIIEDCRGEENTTEEILDLLEDEVEQLHATIENEARKLTFNSTGDLKAQLAEAQNLTYNDGRTICSDSTCALNAADCLAIQACFLGTLQTSKDGGVFGDALEKIDLGPDVVNDQFLYTLCFNETTEELEERKQQTCTDTSITGCTPYIIGNGIGGCQSEPSCPAEIKEFFNSVTPAYPDAKINPSYGASVASIEGIFLCSSGGVVQYNDRTSADAYGITLIIKITLQSLQIAFEVLKDSLPHWFLYFWKVIPYIANEVTINAIDTVLLQAKNHDALVQGAEIEAIYENTRQLLDGSAAVYDEVVCRCADEPRRGQGCDSVDNDCNKVVDECDEDQFPPKIDISRASLHCASGNGQTIWFTSNQDAIACVQEETSVEDDCDAETVFSMSTVTGTCRAANIALNAVDRCGNQAVTATVPVYVDLVNPIVSCSFGPQQELLYVIPDTGAGILRDVAFKYTASDNCGFPLNVKVDVYSNEIEDVHNQKMAVFFRDNKPNDVAGLYLVAQVCTTTSTGQCIKDPSFVPRLYTAVVSATDAAGRSASTECQVLVDPTKGNYTGSAAGSTQRFHLTTYSSVFVG